MKSLKISGRYRILQKAGKFNYSVLYYFSFSCQALYFLEVVAPAISVTALHDSCHLEAVLQIQDIDPHRDGQNPILLHGAFAAL